MPIGREGTLHHSRDKSHGLATLHPAATQGTTVRSFIEPIGALFPFIPPGVRIVRACEEVRRHGDVQEPVRPLQTLRARPGIHGSSPLSTVSTELPQIVGMIDRQPTLSDRLFEVFIEEGDDSTAGIERGNSGGTARLRSSPGP